VKAGYTYYFLANRIHSNGNWLSILAIAIAITALVIAGSYFAVRRLFRPIHDLTDASKKVANGDLNITVATHSKDELGDLAITFNQMVDIIRTLIATKDQLLLDVSHELRSPLTRMKVASEMLSDDKAVQNIKHEIKTLEELVTEILDSARLKHKETVKTDEDVDLHEILTKVTTRLLDNKPGITYTDTINDAHVKGHAMQLEIALKNIVENALKFSEDQPHPVEITLNKDSNCYVICVRDFGSGIDASDIDKIFEPFTRLDKSRNHNKPGFGLGLNIAKGIIDQHRGTIEVNIDKPGVTEFIVSLPQAQI